MSRKDCVQGNFVECDNLKDEPTSRGIGKYGQIKEVYTMYCKVCGIHIGCSDPISKEKLNELKESNE